MCARTGVDAPAKDVAGLAGIGVGTHHRHFPRRSASSKGYVTPNGYPTACRHDEVVDESGYPSACLRNQVEATPSAITGSMGQRIAAATTMIASATRSAGR